MPAVELSWKSVEPPFAPLAVPPLLVKVPLPAVEVFTNSVVPPPPPLTVAPLFVKAVLIPAVALLLKRICPKLPAPSTAVTKFSVIPELFVIPVPLRVSVNVVLAVMVKALAPALNTMPFTSVFAEIDTPVVLEVANVAVSPEPFGTVIGVQFAAVFQSPLPGLKSHCALPAKAGLVLRICPVASAKSRIKVFDILVFIGPSLDCWCAS